MSDDIKALFFDMFGTILDWRTGIAQRSAALLEPLGKRLDFLAFADAWRGEYQPAMEKIRSGSSAFVKLDRLHRANLEKILPAFGLQGLKEETLVRLNRAWHQLDCWPEVGAAMARLRHKFLLAPLSNGNISMMVALARHNGLVFDAILGAEIARDYKPKPDVYLAAAASLDLHPGQCLMVAAHSSDLAAAAGCGLKTAHVARPNEYGPHTGETGPQLGVDFAAGDLDGLADQLLGRTKPSCKPS
jgi:2-haloacid dehalogenase